MRIASFFSIVFLAVSLTASGETASTGARNIAPTASPTPADRQRADFESAIAAVTAEDRSEALSKFVRDYPNSDRQAEARLALLKANVSIGDEKLGIGDVPGAVRYYELAVIDGPPVVDDKTFAETLLPIPGNLFLRGGSVHAAEVAAALEPLAAGNDKRLLALAAFYLNIESGENAERLALAAAELSPESSLVYQTLGLAQRVNFDIDASAASYAKALELAPNAIAVKRDLADMYRAQGDSEAALALYREVLEAEPDDKLARTGVALSLFEKGDRDAAESALDDAIAKDPSNVAMLAGVAYWHAAQGNGDAAVDLADQAIKIEPRYIWSHIAMARGQMLQGNPMDADKTLAAARQFGNFPTLEFEIALTRLKAGLYREAAEEISKSFTIEDGRISTRIGRRILRSAPTFDELLAAERHASLFSAKGAEDREASARLAALLELSVKVAAPPRSIKEVAIAVNKFTAGTDEMKLHRQLYAASLILEKRISPELAQEIIVSAMPNVDAGLRPKQASSAVFASEVYTSRITAFMRDEYLLIPDIPRPTLSAIVRGHIEELAGWAYLQQEQNADAAVRLRRSISVLPVDSAWWRSANWRLGDALAAEGKPEEALEHYIQSYSRAEPDIVKYAVISSLYSRVNNNTDGLEEKIGPNPLPASRVAAQPPRQAETPTLEIGVLPVTERIDEPREVPHADPVTVSEPLKAGLPTDAEPASIPVEKVAEKPADRSVPAASIPQGREKTAPDLVPESVQQNPIDGPLVTKRNESTTPSLKIDNTRPLFEPIVIEIPSTRPRRAAADEAKPLETPSSQNIPEDNQAAPVAIVAPCTIEASQDRVSIVNNGGSVGLIVGTDGDVSTIKASSQAPEDVELRLDPQIAGVAGRAFYLVTSISGNRGEFVVELIAPCGRKSIMVTVR